MTNSYIEWLAKLLILIFIIILIHTIIVLVTNTKSNESPKQTKDVYSLLKNRNDEFHESKFEKLNDDFDVTEDNNIIKMTPEDDLSQWFDNQIDNTITKSNTCSSTSITKNNEPSDIVSWENDINYAPF